MRLLKFVTHVKDIKEVIKVTKTITIYGKEYSNDKNTFVAYSYRKHLDNGDIKYFKVKFRKDCNDRPTKKGYYSLTFNVDTQSLSIEQSKTKEVNGKIFKTDPVIWFKKVISLEPKESLEEIF